MRKIIRLSDIKFTTYCIQLSPKNQALIKYLNFSTLKICLFLSVWFTVRYLSGQYGDRNNSIHCYNSKDYHKYIEMLFRSELSGIFPKNLPEKHLVKFPPAQYSCYFSHGIFVQLSVTLTGM